MMGKRVAVVTGSNKGIGKAIVKELCSHFDGDVFLTSRDVDRGLATVEELNKQELHPKYHQLDIDDEASVLTLRDFLKETYGGLDVLVNNAAISIPWTGGSFELFAEHAKKTLDTNFFNTLRTCNILFPILRPHARVVNLSSMLGHLSRIAGQDSAAVELREKLACSTLSVDELVEIMQSYVEAAKRGDHAEHGWPKTNDYKTNYVVSKIGLSALSRIQQRQFDVDSREDLIVNHVHPGRVITDLSERIGWLSIEEGAVAPSWLAMLPPNIEKPKGCFVWFDKKIVDWIEGPLPV